MFRQFSFLLLLLSCSIGSDISSAVMTSALDTARVNVTTYHLLVAPFREETIDYRQSAHNEIVEQQNPGGTGLFWSLVMASEEANSDTAGDINANTVQSLYDAIVAEIDSGGDDDADVAAAARAFRNGVDATLSYVNHANNNSLTDTDSYPAGKPNIKKLARAVIGLGVEKYSTNLEADDEALVSQIDNFNVAGEILDGATMPTGEECPDLTEPY